MLNSISITVLKKLTLACKDGGGGDGLLNIIWFNEFQDKIHGERHIFTAFFPSLYVCKVIMSTSEKEKNLPER